MFYYLDRFFMRSKIGKTLSQQAMNLCESLFFDEIKKIFL